MARDRTTRWALVAVSAGLVLVLAAQLLAPAMAPATTGPGTGNVLGSTGFAYLGGLRTLVAALLWNRLDPLFDQYYGGGDLDKATYMLPTIRIVTWLDPQFVQAYYVAQWIIAGNGKVPEAVAMTREGLKANPDSGILLASLAQLFLLHSTPASAQAAALDALRPGVKWTDALEQWEQYAILREVFKKAGDTANYDRVVAEMKRLGPEADKIAKEGVRRIDQGTAPAPGATP